MNGNSSDSCAVERSSFNIAFSDSGRLSLVPEIVNRVAGSRYIKLICDRHALNLVRISSIIARTETVAGREQQGAVAQLGERLNGIQEVRGSIPLGSTKINLAFHVYDRLSRVIKPQRSVIQQFKGDNFT